MSRTRTVGGAAGALVTVAALALATAPPVAAKPPTQTPPPVITAGPAGSVASTTATFSFTGPAGAAYTCSLDGAAYGACTSPITYAALAEASHTFRVRAKDGTARVSQPASRSWTVDVTAPGAPAVGQPPSPTSATDVSVAVAATSADTAGYRCSLDGAAYAPCTSPVAVHVTADGAHVLAVTAVDAAGNESAASSVQWVLDTVAPKAHVVTGPPSRTSATSATFIVTVSEPGSTVECALDGGPWAACPGGTVSYADLALGNHSFAARASDAAGNTGTSAAYAWTVLDTVPASLAWAAPGDLPGDPSASASASFAFTATGQTTLECRLDGAALAGCESPAVVSDLGDGPHEFELVADAGTPDEVSLPYAWSVDTTAPAAPSLAGPTGLVRSTSASIVFAAEPGTTLSCTLDGAPYLPCTGLVELTGLEQGAHGFSVSASDAVGNASTSSIAWTVDSVSPVASAVAPTTLTGATRVLLSEPVTGVTATSVGLRVTGTSTLLATTLGCRDAAGAVVTCSSASVREVRVTPRAALLAGQYYTAVVAPNALADAAGNTVAATRVGFRAVRTVEESGPGTRQAWRTVWTSKALGGSYATERRAGASATFAVSGTSFTWYTAKGPSMGRATVYVDGVKRSSVDNYASSTTYRVGRTVSGLSSGSHVVKVVVSGTRATRSTGTWVVLDAARWGGVTRSTPSLTARWRSVADTKALAGRYALADVAGASTQFTFRGTSVRWWTVRGPGMGQAKVYVDGTYKGTVDLWSSARTYRTYKTWTGLADKVHTVKVVVTGNHRSGASGSWVAVDRWSVG